MERIDKSAMIPLKFCCSWLGEIKCEIATDINWVHKKCNSQIYIDDNGDIYCDKDCPIPKKNRFVQYWKFNCGKDHTAEYSAVASSFDLHIIFQITSQSAKNHYKEDKKSFQEHSKKLASNLTARWQEIDN